MAHFIKQCKHGVIESRCRCIGPHDVTIVPCMTNHHGVLLHEVCKAQTEINSDLWR